MLKWKVTLKLSFSSTALVIVLICLLQALCKLSELDSSEKSKEYKDPTDAYVVGDAVRGNGIVFLLLFKDSTRGFKYSNM